MRFFRERRGSKPGTTLPHGFQRDKCPDFSTFLVGAEGLEPPTPPCKGGLPEDPFPLGDLPATQQQSQPVHRVRPLRRRSGRRGAKSSIGCPGSIPATFFRRRWSSDCVASTKPLRTATRTKPFGLFGWLCRSTTTWKNAVYLQPGGYQERNVPGDRER